ncbi:MAG: hypothetical protein M3P08_08050 [Thermoproteota archaeon]|nr:hypothetical protein [Thermoproteota archaeon]
MPGSGRSWSEFFTFNFVTTFCSDQIISDTYDSNTPDQERTSFSFRSTGFELEVEVDTVTRKVSRCILKDSSKELAFDKIIADNKKLLSQIFDKGINNSVNFMDINIS